MLRTVKQTAGFSLLGQLITLTLAGIMLSIAVPGYLKVMPANSILTVLARLNLPYRYNLPICLRRPNQHKIYLLNLT